MASRIGVCGMLALSLWLQGCARERASQLPHEPQERRERRTEVSASSGAGCSDEERQQRAKKTLRGLATYYHDSLSGNLTASGQRYDPADLSAAHRTLPFGTRLRVSRADQARASICVTVNDRGPFGGKGRIIDVSRRAAEQLDMLRAGVVPVLVEVL